MIEHLDRSNIEHHDVSMRTTLTLDPDVARLLKEEARRRGVPFKQVVNEAIRKSLSPRMGPGDGPYTVTPHPGTLRPGFDRGSFGRLADELEAEAAAEKAAKP